MCLGKLRSFKVGKLRRILVADLEAYVNEHGTPTVDGTKAAKR
jgi:hypothetical protein